MEEKLNDLECLCRPIIEYLRAEHNPHTVIVIKEDKIELLQQEIGIPVSKND